MNETIYRDHYAAANRYRRPSKRLDPEKSLKVHKAICAAIATRGLTSSMGTKSYHDDVYGRAKERLKGQYGSLVGFFLWPVIWAILRPILEAMLPIILEWLIEQAVSNRMGDGERALSLREWGNS